MRAHNPDTWPQMHMRQFALSRWENEGGAFLSQREARPQRRHRAAAYGACLVDLPAALTGLRPGPVGFARLHP